MPCKHAEKWHFDLKEKQIFIWTGKTNEWMFVNKYKVSFDVSMYIFVFCFGHYCFVKNKTFVSLLNKGLFRENGFFFNSQRMQG